VNNDIAVNIVTSLPVPGVNPETPSTTKANVVAAQSTPSSPIPAAPAPAPSNKVETKPDAIPSPSQSQTPPSASTTDTKPAAASAPAKSAALGLAAGEEVVATSKPKVSSDSSSSKPAANTGKFVIQTEAFKSEDRLNGWLSKMKAQKIPTYVINKTSADGTKLFVLRAGPFPDKDAAEAAEKKIKAMGLNSRIVDAGKS